MLASQLIADIGVCVLLSQLDNADVIKGVDEREFPPEAGQPTEVPRTAMQK